MRFWTGAMALGMEGAGSPRRGKNGWGLVGPRGRGEGGFPPGERLVSIPALPMYYGEGNRPPEALWSGLHDTSMAILAWKPGILVAKLGLFPLDLPFCRFRWRKKASHGTEWWLDWMSPSSTHKHPEVDQMSDHGCKAPPPCLSGSVFGHEPVNVLK